MRMTREAEEAIEGVVAELQHILQSHRDATPTEAVPGPERIEPVALDEHGTPRFRANEIVRFLLDNGPHDMNTLAVMDFDQETRQHFAQLIGYSVDGYGSLSYVSTESYERAAAMAESLLEAPDERE